MTPALRVYCRVTGSENAKSRPQWHSKRVSLLSLLQAVDVARSQAPVQVVYVVDGAPPSELADLLAATGSVRPISAGSAARSFRRLLDISVAEVPRDVLLWLAEDDYLYRPEALDALLDAAAAAPDVDYFGLYTPDNLAWHATHVSQPDRRGPHHELRVGEAAWSTAAASNSTFAVRAAALRRDAPFLRLCSFAGSSWDHACLCGVQGIPPYDWRYLHRDLLPPSSRGNLVRDAVQPPLRAVINTAARARRRRRLWLSSDVDLATHVEEGHLAGGYDWASLAQALRS